MPQKQFINPSHFAVSGGSYSQAVRVGDLVYLSGQIAVDEENNALAPGDAEEQTRIIIQRMADILTEVGGTLADIVSTTIYLTDLSLFADYNRAWSAGFGDHRPARATVGADIVLPGVVVEIQAIAHLDS